MPLPRLPLELLLIIAHQLRDDSGELRYSDFNSFLQVNRVLYACLNPLLWQSAVKHNSISGRVFTHLIRTDNLARLQLFLELGADVETILSEINDEYYDDDPELEDPTPLVLAASFDNVPMARILLEHGAKLFQPGDYGYKAMHAARSAEMVQLLLDYHGDPNQVYGPDNCLMKPLHFYAMRGNIAAMRVALENGAEVDPDDVFWMPLHEAARNSIDAVLLLLEYGADIIARDLDEDTPLHYAAEAGLVDVVRLFLERYPAAMRERNSAGCTSLHLAASTGKIDVVRFLVELWPEGKKSIDNAGRTPLKLFENFAMAHVNAAVTEKIVALLT